MPQPHAVTDARVAYDPEFLTRLRLLSRYLRDVGDELLARLEEVYGEVENLGPAGEREEASLQNLTRTPRANLGPSSAESSAATGLMSMSFPESETRTHDSRLIK